MSSYNSEPNGSHEPFTPTAGDEFLVTNNQPGAKEHAQAAADSVAGPAKDVKNEAASAGREVKDHAVDAGRDVKDQAVGAGKDVARNAQNEAAQVIDEAKYQGRRLFDEGVTELRSQAGTVQSRLAAIAHELSDELGAMADAPNANGPMAQLARTGRTWGNDAASFLDNNDVDGVVRSVRRYAARNPWSFLAIAGGVGLVAGRLARGVKDAQPSNDTTYTRRQVYGHTPQTVQGYAPDTAHGVQTEYRGDAYADTPYVAPQQGDVLRDQRDGGIA